MIQETYDKNRVLNFTDAVFSIVMTLLILEVGVPSIQELDTKTFGQVLSSRIPDFIGLLVSFLVSALFWIGNLRLMKFVSTMTPRLVWLTILFLLTIIILPFSTAMYVNGFDNAGPFIFYCANLITIGVFNLILLKYVYKHEGGKTGFSRAHYRWFRARSTNVIVIWTIAALLATSSFWSSRMVFLLLFIIQVFIDRRFKKKLNMEV